MELLQLFLHLNDQFYRQWREGSGFRALKRILDAADSDRLPVAYRLRIPQPKSSGRYTPVDIGETARYARAVMYLPMLPDQHYHNFRNRIGIGSAAVPNIQVVQFRVNPIDVPEYLHWRRMSALLEAALDQDAQAFQPSIYGLPASASSLMDDVIDAVLLPNDLYLKRIKDDTSCNSRFLMNLFFGTRNHEAFDDWIAVTEMTYQTVHNALVAQARLRGWTALIRRILDGDPAIAHPFELFSGE